MATPLRIRSPNFNPLAGQQPYLVTITCFNNELPFNSPSPAPHRPPPSSQQRWISANSSSRSPKSICLLIIHDHPGGLSRTLPPRNKHRRLRSDNPPCSPPLTGHIPAAIVTAATRCTFSKPLACSRRGGFVSCQSNPLSHHVFPENPSLGSFTVSLDIPDRCWLFERIRDIVWEGVRKPLEKGFTLANAPSSTDPRSLRFVLLPRHLQSNTA